MDPRGRARLLWDGREALGAYTLEQWDEAYYPWAEWVSVSILRPLE
jgi:hypothetical protein